MLQSLSAVWGSERVRQRAGLKQAGFCQEKQERQQWAEEWIECLQSVSARLGPGIQDGPRSVVNGRSTVAKGGSAGVGRVRDWEDRRVCVTKAVTRVPAGVRSQPGRWACDTRKLCCCCWGCWVTFFPSVPGHRRPDACSVCYAACLTVLSCRPRAPCAAQPQQSPHSLHPACPFAQPTPSHHGPTWKTVAPAMAG